MNTTTTRLQHYLYDDEKHYVHLQAFVHTVGGKEDSIAQVSAWLKQQFASVYDHLDERDIQWEDLARHFIREIVPQVSLGMVRQDLDELDELLAFDTVQAWLLAQPTGAIVGTASRACQDQDDRHARNVLARYVSAKLGVTVYINWKGIRVGRLDAPFSTLGDFCFRYLQLLECLAAGASLTDEIEVRREVALTLWERLKEILVS